MVNLSSKKRVIIFGAYGLLGSYLSKYLKKNGYTIFNQGRSNLADYTVDPLSDSEVSDFIEYVKPTNIINLNALTDVDLCESDPEMCHQANVRTVEIIVENIKDSKVHLLHISSDQVYSEQGPHFEEDVKPSNSYSRSKYNSELIAQRVNSTILRTNFVGKSFKKSKVSYTDWLIESFKKNTEITLFNDIKFSPVHQSFLSKVIDKSIEDKIKGLFNVGSKDSMLKSDFALKLSKDLNFNFKNYKLMPSKLIDRPAKRPLDMSLNSEKFNKYFNISSPFMTETISLIRDEYLYEKNTSKSLSNRS